MLGRPIFSKIECAPGLDLRKIHLFKFKAKYHVISQTKVTYCRADAESMRGAVFCPNVGSRGPLTIKNCNVTEVCFGFGNILLTVLNPSSRIYI